MEPNVLLYLKSWSDELLSRAGRVRLLIGDAHWLSDGHHKEYLLRDFFSRHLPSGLLISRGFVRPPDDDVHCSPENDILLSDPARHAPFFNEGGLVITPPSSVVAFVEAKTTLTKKKVKEAVETQAATMHTIATYVPNAVNIWRGIVFATVRPAASLSTSLATIRHAISSVFVANSSLDSACLPKCIASYDRYLFLIAPLDSEKYQIRGFDLGGLSIACFFSEMLAGIGAMYHTPHPHRQLGDIITRISATHISHDAGIREVGACTEEEGDD